MAQVAREERGLLAEAARRVRPQVNALRRSPKVVVPRLCPGTCIKIPKPTACAGKNCGQSKTMVVNPAIRRPKFNALYTLVKAPAKPNVCGCLSAPHEEEAQLRWCPGYRPQPHLRFASDGMAAASDTSVP